MFGMNNNNCKNGVIVEKLNEESPISYTIVDFNNRQSAYVLRSFLEKYLAKACMLLKDDKPYEVFENINYEANHRNLVDDYFARNKMKKWECADKGNGVFVVKAACVFSSDTPTTCFTDIAGEVEFSEDMISHICCADVVFNCWLQFSFVSHADVNLIDPEVHPVTFKLYSVEEVNCDKLEFAYNAPWNKAFARIMYDYSDPFLNQMVPEHTRKFTFLKAYYLSGKSIYIPSRPRWPVLLASNKIKLVSEGSKIENHIALYVDVQFNSIINRFVVCDARSRYGDPLNASMTPDGYHEALAFPVDACPGFFSFGKNGLIFDRFGELADIYWAPSGTVSTCAFSYADPDDFSYTSLEIPQSSGMDVEHILNNKHEGLYIGNNEFFTPYLHFCLLKLPDEAIAAEYKVGYWYSLKIQNVDSEKYAATVKETVLIPDYDHIPFKTIGKSDYEFLVQVSVHHCAIFQFLVAPYLGALGVKEFDRRKVFHARDELPKFIFTACGIKFQAAEELPENRPQVRAQVVKYFKDFEKGMKEGSYN